MAIPKAVCSGELRMGQARRAGKRAIMRRRVQPLNGLLAPTGCCVFVPQAPPPSLGQIQALHKADEQVKITVEPSAVSGK